MPVAFAQNSRDEVRLVGGDGGVVGALAAEPGMKQQTFIAYQCQGTNVGEMGTLRRGNGGVTAGVPFLAYAIQERAHAEGKSGPGTPLIAHTLATDCGEATEDGTRRGSPLIAHTLASSGVRRLTPLECERLQGFPDGYTAVPYRGKPMSDAARYRMIGNSMAVNVMRWTGQRIEMAEGIT